MELAVAILALFLGVPAFFLSVYNFVIEKVRHDSLPKEVILNREQARGQVREIAHGMGSDVPSIYDPDDDEEREPPEFEEII